MAAEAPKKNHPALRKPELARAELLDKGARARFDEELEAVLRRKPLSEARLAGALRALAPFSPEIRSSLVRATQELVKRGATNRELYAAAIRELSESQDKRVIPLLKTALSAEDAGGSATLSAACFSDDPQLTPQLAKLAATRHSLTSFCAETARVVRKESNGALLERLAPMIKEAHRITMCVDIFVPLVRTPRAPKEIGRALFVLREAERHLGRWLVLAEVAQRGGDPTPLEEAKRKSLTGPESARAAWALVAWALASGTDRDGVAPNTGAGGAGVPPPDTRPTIELVARLSDRPSANRDMTFLFRMASARVKSARPMMEAMTKALPLADENAVRAALYLARDHGRDDLRPQLEIAARQSKKEELRGFALAALKDLGAEPSGAAHEASSSETREGHESAVREIATELLGSKNLGNVAWAALVLRAQKARDPRPVLTERAVRFIQWGWLE